MNLWLFKAARTIIILITIIVAGFLTFNKILTISENAKPPINLVPDEIRSPHFVNSYPAHNQFLATLPASVVINFDTGLTSAEASINLGGEPTEAAQEKLEKSIKLQPAIPKSGNVENGIYLVLYNACFSANDCINGQFTFHIDDTTITQFINETANVQIRIIITDNPDTIRNLFIKRRDTVEWVNQTNTSIKIKSAPSEFNNAFPQLNSEEIKSGESFKVQFDNRGEYLWYLESNPKFQGRILAS